MDDQRVNLISPAIRIRKLVWGFEQGFKQSLFSPRQLHGWQPYTLAAAGSLTGIDLPAAAGQTPGGAGLAATEDVQLTAAIQAQAAALNNNPVQIHNWVRNNIEFIPSYGSIQGADCMTPIQKC